MEAEEVFEVKGIFKCILLAECNFKFARFRKCLSTLHLRDAVSRERYPKLFEVRTQYE